MASKILLKGSEAVSVYDDRFLPIYEALGASINVSRASQVEYDSDTCEWVAVSGGVEVARGPVRADVIKAEINYLEGRLDRI